MINLKNFIQELKNLIIKNNMIWKEPLIHHEGSQFFWELEWFPNTKFIKTRLFIYLENGIINYLQIITPTFDGMNEGVYSEEKFIELWKWLND